MESNLAPGKLVGIPTESGLYPFSIEVSQGDVNLSRDIKLIVRGENLAASAIGVLATVASTNVVERDSMWLSVAYSLYNDDVSVIRDGNRLGNGSTFYSIGDDLAKIKDYYGYKWDQPVNIGLVNLNMGSMEESGGWFTSIDVEIFG